MTTHTVMADPAAVAAVRALYQQLMDGWNKGSGEAFAAPGEDARYPQRRRTEITKPVH
jgi:hypothetical protein